MLTANERDAEAGLPPELAQPLEALCSAISAKLTARSAQFDDLNASFSAMQSVVTRTICESSKQWNRSHDYFRVLPVELQAMCWAYLPQANLVRLARVCSSWRDLSRGIPSLWTTLHVNGPVSNLDILFSRSGRLPFDVSVTVYSSLELAYFDDCVRKHGDRVRSLRISDRNVLALENRRVYDLFRYPAPVLAHFSFKLNQVNHGDFHVPSDIFNCHAPNLRSLTLHEIPFPASSPAFGGLKKLTFQWSLDIIDSGLAHVFADSPGLEFLALSEVPDIRGLPRIPKSSMLRRMTLTAKTVCFTTLCSRGYLNIPQLEVVTHDSRALLHPALHNDPSLHATLSIASTDASSSTLILRSDHGAVATFITDAVIIEQAADFSTLERLVIPSAAPYCHTLVLPEGNRAQNPYILNDLHLPALRTLTLAHGAYRLASLFDPTVLLGAFNVPRLSRLEITRASDNLDSTLPGPDAINPGLLAQFIEKHIECGDPASLELFIDGENADLLNIRDEDGMERLRHCVGKIVYG